MKKDFALMCILAVIAAACESGVDPADPRVVTGIETPDVPGDLSIAQRILEMTNAYRGENSIPALALSPELGFAAQLHAEDMADKGYFSHTSQDGRSAGDRMSDAGYDWRTWGENIAYGYSTPEAAMNGWINSAGHRANILNGSFEDLGVGYAVRSSGGTAYWVQNFGAR